MKTVRDRKGWYAAVGILLAVTVIFSSVTYVRAADTNLFLQNYMTEEDKVIVYCANFTADKESGDTGQFTAMISGQECPVLEVSTVEEKQEGITYYCLVDVSGSMHQEQMEQAKSVLAQICGSLGEKDNMVIGAIGTTLETTGFLTDKEKIMKVIDGLTGESDYTAIYDAVIDSISVLKSNHSCNRKKCLVLISDGYDETTLGTTQTEVTSAVTDSKIPVYTVAAMRQSPTAQQKESAENLGAFARQSVGGKDYPPIGKEYSSVAEEFDAEEAGRGIVEDMQNGVILTLDVSGIAAANDEVLLSVSLKTDTATYSDTMYLYAADLKFSSGNEGETETITEQPTETEPQPEPTTEPGPQPEPAAKLSVYVMAAGAALILIVLVIIIFVCRRNKAKKEAAEEAARKEEAERETAEREGAVRKAQEEQEKEARKRKREEEKKAKAADMTQFCTPIPEKGPYYEVKFTAINHEDVVFTLNVPEEKTVTIGRNKKADLVLNAEDKHLSSVQCKVCCMQNAMNVWDMNSQNGTFVNGVPIRQIGMATVQNNDVIRMGSYEYRVNIMKR